MKAKNKRAVVSSEPLNAAERRAIAQAYAPNRRLFGRDLAKLKLIVCHSPKEWRRESRYYYFPFANGLVLRDGTVVVKSRRLAGKSFAEWGKIITHEFNHSFYIQGRSRGRDLWSPIWFLEGLACYVAGNDVVLSRKELADKLLLLPGMKIGAASDAAVRHALLPYRYRAALFPNAKQLILHYSLWCHFVGHLAKRRASGIKQLLRRLHTCSEKAQFESCVREIWGWGLERLIEEFLTELQVRRR